jgi:coenzyme F420-reducing hydrogenase gamma subunit
MKPKIAFFDFGCCEGCQLTVSEMEDELLDILNLVEIVNWRELADVRRNDYDVAFGEGSVLRPEDVPRLIKIRENAKVLVAIGACATTAGVNAIKNLAPNAEEVRRYVYGDKWDKFESFEARPFSAVVKVDYELHGCPMEQSEFKELLKALLFGKPWRQKRYPVCVECKIAGNTCVYDLGMTCMGPVTRAGCGARCPSFGYRCEACHGFVDNPNADAEKEVLARHGLSVKSLLNDFQLFNSYTEASKK